MVFLKLCGIYIHQENVSIRKGSEHSRDGCGALRCEDNSPGPTTQLLEDLVRLPLASSLKKDRGSRRYRAVDEKEDMKH